MCVGLTGKAQVGLVQDGDVPVILDSSMPSNPNAFIYENLIYLEMSELTDLSTAALVHLRNNLSLRHRAPRISGVDSGLEELTPIMALAMRTLS